MTRAKECTVSRLSVFSTFSALGARPMQEDEVWMRREAGVFVLADGFGGGPGARAAALACEKVGSFLCTQSRDPEATLPHVFHSYYSLQGNLLFNALVHANQAVHRENSDRSINARGGASALAAYFDEGYLALGNVGCCSAWLLRRGIPKELLVPRDYARLRDPLDALQDFSAPLMALGMDRDLEPEIVELRVEPGDWVLLHTDGFRRQHRETLFSFQARDLPQDQAISMAIDRLRTDDFRDNTSFLLLVAS